MKGRSVKVILGVSAMALAAALASHASAQDINMFDPRFEAKNVCDYIAGVTGSGPFTYSTTGLAAGGEAVTRGAIDLDGDGTDEFIMTPGNEMSEELSFAIKPDGTQTPLTEAIEGYGTGTRFLPFHGRWYLVNSSTSYGAYVLAAYSFAKGSLKPEPTCKFDNETKETMAQGVDGGAEDGEWCAATALSDAAAYRLKPAATLSAAQKAALMAQVNADGLERPESAGDIYKPTIGPFAGLLLWKAKIAPYLACTGSTFTIIADDGAGGYKLAPGDKQKELDLLQGNEGFYNTSCTPDVEIFETKGRFFVERYWGGGKQTDDHQLIHSIQELKDGKTQEICAAYFEVTPKVTWMSPDQPK
ncbi:hypothetical protein sos41_19620 [Alphaproteobacteria bacterium SO-S41]|nr:hypothetical protein sos41_19620 [Alphaproteobacteria bacterium SO-S41]